MKARATFLGHPVHQMLIVLPLGLLSGAVLFDVVYLIGGNGRFADISFWMILAGIVTGLLAAVFGTIDWLSIPARTRAKTVGLMHGVGNVIVILLYSVSWGMRYSDPLAPSMAALVMSASGLVLAMVTGWLGGELVDRLGVGVHEGAHLDAPNSLSGRPARPSIGEPAEHPIRPGV